jgi:hypothetical protein
MARTEKTRRFFAVLADEELLLPWWAWIGYGDAVHQQVDAI